MPTDRAKAALRFLLANNAFYKVPDDAYDNDYVYAYDYAYVYDYDYDYL